MPSFDGLLIVSAVAFLAPFTLGLLPRLRLPSIVVEIVLGIVIGPSVLGLVEIDQAIEVLSLVGLAFILFLSGLEIEFEQLRGRPLRLAATGWALSFAVAVAVGFLLRLGGFVDTPLLVAIILCATSLGVVVAVLKDAGEVASPFGQLIIAAGSIADFGAIILLSLFFSGEGGLGSTLLLLGGLLGVAGAVLLAVRGSGRSSAVMRDLARLQDTTAQIRVRGAVLLMIGFVALAEAFGLEAILGAFAAGAILSLVDRDKAMTHPDFRRKLDAIGFGFVIPVFFVASGVRFDLDALLGEPTNLAMVPVFLAALVAVRALPALLYRGLVGGRRSAVAGLLQATSLPFIVAATAIGQELGLLDGAQAAGLIAAGLMSVLLFPASALALLNSRPSRRLAPATEAS
ncbi:MAG TPA: cation:proton antiporter [Solirubrobacteraceae bacterium]|nr:cation:proton antiporter [Solirubrobacteraceae bacterium]